MFNADKGGAGGGQQIRKNFGRHLSIAPKKVSAEFLSSGEFLVKMLDPTPGEDGGGDDEYY